MRKKKVVSFSLDPDVADSLKDVISENSRSDFANLLLKSGLESYNTCQSNNVMMCNAPPTQSTARYIPTMSAKFSLHPTVTWVASTSYENSEMESKTILGRGYKYGRK